MNLLCRKLGIKFIATESRGLCAGIFVDFGDNFEIIDKDGENVEISLITGITNVKKKI
jgi:ubiquitin-activating enzyme E1